MAITRRGESGPPAPHRAQREWDPFQSMRDLMRWEPFWEMFPRHWRGERHLEFAPDFDVRESKDAYVFKADLPGFREEDIEINLTGNRLTVSGKREVEHGEESDTEYVSERSFGAFTRAFTLPEGVNADHVSADFKNGVLTVRLPKTPEAQPKRIEVRGGGTETKKIKA